jgi:hypothetical protein
MIASYSVSGTSTEKKKKTAHVCLKNYAYCFHGLKKEQRETKRTCLHEARGHHVAVTDIKRH